MSEVPKPQPPNHSWRGQTTPKPSTLNISYIPRIQNPEPRTLYRSWRGGADGEGLGGDGPTSEGAGYGIPIHVYLHLHVYICKALHLSIYLSIYLSFYIYLSIYLSIYQSLYFYIRVMWFRGGEGLGGDHLSRRRVHTLRPLHVII